MASGAIRCCFVLALCKATKHSLFPKIVRKHTIFGEHKAPEVLRRRGGMETMISRSPSYPHSPAQTHDTIKDSQASIGAQQSPKYNIRYTRTYLKPSEMNDLYTLKTYIRLMGKGRNKRQNNW